MAKINIFQGISNEYKTYEKSGLLKDALKEIFLDKEIDSFIILEGGNELPANYVLKDEDIVFVRERPGATGTVAVVCGIIGIVTAAAALGVGIYSAIENHKAQEEAEKAQRAAKALSEQPNARPFLKGSNNLKALGYNIPFIMGQTYFTPYKLSDGFFTIENNSEYSKWVDLSDSEFQEAVKQGAFTTYKMCYRNNGSYTMYKSTDEENYRIKSQTPERGGVTNVKAEKRVTAPLYNGDQYWNCPLIIGYNDVYVQDVSIGNVKIASANKILSVPQLNGTTRNFPYIEPDTNTIPFDQGLYYSPNNKLEIINKGRFNIPYLNEKIIALPYTDELEYNKEVIKQLPENTYKYEICIKFDGLRVYNDGWKEKSVSFKIETYLDDVLYKTDTFTTPSQCSGDTLRFIFKRNLRKEMRYFSFGDNNIITRNDVFEKNVTVKITRLTEKSEQSQETSSLLFINSYCYDNTISTLQDVASCEILSNPFRDQTSRLGLKVIANENTKDVLAKINMNVCGAARIWNKITKTWTEEKYPTRNPASWILEIMTSDIHKHSHFDDSEIDLQSLGELYEYCEQNSYHCDGVLTSDSKKSDILNKILVECDSTMYMNNMGLWTFAIEKKQTVPVALLNDQSIKSITVSKAFSRKATAQKVTFLNNKTWAIDTIYFDNNGNTKGETVYDTNATVTETATNYITDYEHAIKFARRLMAKQRLQPREITVQVGKEGDYYPLYSKVLLQMRALKIGISSGIIKQNLGTFTQNNIEYTKFLTSDKCDFSNTLYKNRGYGVRIQTKHDGCVCAHVIGSENTNILNIKSSDITGIDITDGIYSFGILNNGEFSQITSDMIITASKPNQDGWELTLKDYNDEIYNTGTIPPYRSNITVLREDIQNKNDFPTYGQIKAEIIESKVQVLPPLQLDTLTAVANQDYIKIVATNNKDTISDYSKTMQLEISKNNGSTWEAIGSVPTEYNYELKNYPEKSDLAKWKFRAKSQNVFNLASENYITCNVDYSQYLTWKPSNPTLLKVKALSDGTGLVFTWNTSTTAMYGNEKYQITYKYNNAQRTVSDVYDTKTTVLFDRTIEGYPEKSDLTSKISFSIKAVNTQSKKASDSVTLETANIDTTQYLTWKPDFTVSATTSGRTATLLMETTVSNYGNNKWQIRIKKQGESSFYKPNITGSPDPYANESAYKENSTAFITSISGFSQKLPLTNQSTAPTETSYIYELKLFNESGYVSTAKTITAIAKPTGAVDLANLTITNNKIANGTILADKLDANVLSAQNLATKGMVAGQAIIGKLSGDAQSKNNYWDLETGEFRIGNDLSYENQSTLEPTNANASYLHFKKIGNAWNLVIAMTKIVMSSLATTIRGVFKVRTNNNQSDFLIINPESTANENTTAKTLKVNGGIHINRQTDVEPNSFDTDPLTIGIKNGANIGIDDNEIMARNNGAISTLHLNVGGTTNATTLSATTLSATDTITSSYNFFRRVYLSNATSQSPVYILIGKCVAPSDTSTNITSLWDIAGDFSVIRATGHSNLTGHLIAYCGYSFAWKVGGSVDYVTSRSNEQIVIGTLKYNNAYYVALRVSYGNEGHYFTFNGYSANNKSQILFTVVKKENISEFTEFSKDERWIKNQNIYIPSKVTIGDTSTNSANNRLTIKGLTTGTNTYADNNPKIEFQNESASQNISLTYSDFDSIVAPASLTLNGNQGGEYFIAPNITATSKVIASQLAVTGSETHSGSVVFSGAIKVPTSAPSVKEEGNIWVV